jgi:long-chain acyl-CoA synthetase
MSPRPPIDVIAPEVAGTLGGLLRERARRTPEGSAYRWWDPESETWTAATWADTAAEVARWQEALAREPLEPGDRVAIMLPNSLPWVLCDQAALGLGLAVVPLYVNDRPENVAYVLEHSGARLLLIEGAEQWRGLRSVRQRLEGLVRILSLHPLEDEAHDPRLLAVERWLPRHPAKLQTDDADPQSLATIVYTSGTTGPPKGVMLSHTNLLWNAYASLQAVPSVPGDLFLSFLPLSHAFERTAGYYLPMMAGATVAYARSVPQLADDLLTVRPTVLVSVPRIYERVHARIRGQLEERTASARRLFERTVEVGWGRFQHEHGRGPWGPSHLLWPILDRLVARKITAKLGGRLRLAICGGAPLPPHVARVFIGLGVPLLQGYGLTEASPVLCVNRVEDSEPASVGAPLEGVELRLGDQHELLARSPGVMLGYWQDPEATRAAIDGDGWLHTGDQARIETGHVYITGRLKEILVLANGEKVPPADMEMAAQADPLVEQIMILGDSRPYLSALVVVNTDAWHAFARSLGLAPEAASSLEDPNAQSTVLERLGECLHAFPGYAQIRRVALVREPWTPENGLLTPTLKLKREGILQHHAALVAELYRGHE